MNTEFISPMKKRITPTTSTKPLAIEFSRSATMRRMFFDSSNASGTCTPAGSRPRSAASRRRTSSQMRTMFSPARFWIESETLGTPL